MDPSEHFNAQVAANISDLGANQDIHQLSRTWSRETNRHGYTYNFSWLGRPIIQYPQDIVALQELVWTVQPDLIIETGIAHGGSLIFSASMLELNAACGGPTEAEVIGVDIDIRAHSRTAIEAHPMSKRITMIEGSSTTPEVVERIQYKAASKQRVLVCLDSNHAHEHVLGELNAYAPLTTVGSYCVVFDTLIEEMPAEMFADRPWGPGNSPFTAVSEYLKTHPEFEPDNRIDHKLLISVAPNGYLKRVR
jgi:cephalosporin hydroxylase